MANKNKYQFPLVIERDEDGFYVVECPVFSGCYSQGKTRNEAIKNIKEVIDLCLEEKENQSILNDYRPQKIQYKTLNYA